MSSDYYVPTQSKLPLITALGLGLMAFGGATLANAAKQGEAGLSSSIILLLGALVLAGVMYAWFNLIIEENHQGLANAQLNQSYVLGMSWFIFSEIMFFAAFFGSLFYVRYYVGPWIDGDGAKGVTEILAPNFEFTWPSTQNPSTEFIASPRTVDPFSIPLINTILLFASSLSLTGAHDALRKKNQSQFNALLIVTLLLGFAFIAMQVVEYVEAYTHLGLTLQTGIYGSTFFILTGFHGAHVTIGSLMLLIMLIRSFKGDFFSKPNETDHGHFGFTASAWYWHFVDVVWIMLFVFVYIV
jgi:cytochrome c oxidase subunit III